MARGNNRRRNSLGGGRRATIDVPLPNLAALNASSAAIASGTIIDEKQELRDAIDFHWRNLSQDSSLRTFLLSSPSELTLSRFVDYWSATPSRKESTSPNIAASICGCSWYLALNYKRLGDLEAARALILNGSFMQQCYNQPIEEIAKEVQAASPRGSADCRYFTDGLLATSSEQRMASFLRSKVSSDYHRRMSFATQTSQTKQKVHDYVNQISSDWNEGGSAGQAQARRRRSSTTIELGQKDRSIEIILVDSKTKEEARMTYSVNLTLKSLFKQYAEDRGLNLRQLRFSFQGRTLFLSAVGNKTPQDLGIVNLDEIVVTNQAAASDSSSSSDESKNSSRSCPAKLPSSKKRFNRRNSRKSSRRASWAGPEVNQDERYKLAHSRNLGSVLNEASLQFMKIRQKLAAMNLECTPPKAKSAPRGKNGPAELHPLPPVANSNEGGKAGVPFYPVHVGPPENLYNTRHVFSPAGQRPATVDLHGLTRSEAVAELDSRLPAWYESAMRGEYPFILKVTIVCGGGNQIISEAVDRWIKTKDVVSKAPKFSRRRSA